MPTPFVSRALAAVDNIFKFVGNKAAPSEFALESAIQPVYDFSRQSEIGSGLVSGEQGYFTIQETGAHAGAGIIRDTADPWAIVETESQQRESSGVWLIDGWGRVNTAANFVQGAISVTYPITPLGFNGDDFLCFFWDTAGPIVVTGQALLDDVARPAERVQLPFYLPDGCTMNFMTEAVTGAATIRVAALCWAGARGALPPGLA